MSVRNAVRSGQILINMLVSITILVVAGLALYFLPKLAKSPPTSGGDTERLPAVLVDAVREHSAGLRLEVDGLVEPHREIVVSAEVGGRVTSKSPLLRAGRFVQEGELLLTINDEDYQLEKQRLTQELEQAKISVTEIDRELEGNQVLCELAKEEVALRQREIDRQREISELVSEAEVDRAKMSLITARNAQQKLLTQDNLLNARKTRLRQSIELATTQLERAELNIARTQVRAPISGVIVQELVESDAYVQPGTSLFSIEDTSRVEVACRLRMEDLYWLWNEHRSSQVDAAKMGLYELPKLEVEVLYTMTGSIERTYQWKGRLDRYDGIGLDTQTRTVPCRVVVEDPTQPDALGPPALLRGMYVTVVIHTRPNLNILAIPERALRPGDIVWRVRDGLLETVEVDFVELFTDEVLTPQGVRSRDSMALIIPRSNDDLKPSDNVVTSPLPFVTNRMKVRVTSPTADSEPQLAESKEGSTSSETTANN